MNIKLENLHDSTDVNHEVTVDMVEFSEELDNGNKIIKNEIEDIDFELNDLHHSIDIKEEISSNSSNPDQDHETEICELFACEVCNLIFTSKLLLGQHVKIHSVEQQFLCKICNRRFLSKTSLRKHLKVHPDEKPFACEICDFKSSREENLKIHLRTHTGEKPYGCKLCNFKCFLKENFKTHLTTHMSVKPFKCKICEFKSSRLLNLNNRISTHNHEKIESPATTSRSPTIYSRSSSYGSDNSYKRKGVPKDAVAEGIPVTINPIVHSFVPKTSIQIFTEFVGNQLEYLQSDENILLATQEEITNSIWKARRKACSKNVGT